MDSSYNPIIGMLMDDGTIENSAGNLISINSYLNSVTPQKKKFFDAESDSEIAAISDAVKKSTCQIMNDGSNSHCSYCEPFSANVETATALSGSENLPLITKAARKDFSGVSQSSSSNISDTKSKTITTNKRITVLGNVIVKSAESSLAEKPKSTPNIDHHKITHSLKNKRPMEAMNQSNAKVIESRTNRSVRKRKSSSVSIHHSYSKNPADDKGEDDTFEAVINGKNVTWICVMKGCSARIKLKKHLKQHTLAYHGVRLPDGRFVRNRVLCLKCQKVVLNESNFDTHHKLKHANFEKEFKWFQQYSVDRMFWE